MRSWTLGGFRAIGDETVFDLGGLNILVGANSAGKSSVLHSLLLAAQTLATPMADRPLVLNGPLVRLGLADDCVHEEKDREITIGFGLVPSEDELSRPAMSELTWLEVSSKFVVPEGGGADFLLAGSSVIAHTVDEPGQVQLDISHRSRADALQMLRDQGAESEIAEQYADVVGLAANGVVPNRTVGAYARQFLPDSFAILANAYLREFHSLLRPWGRQFGFRQHLPARKRDFPVSEPAATLVREFVADSLGSGIAEQLPEEITPEAFGQLPKKALDALGSIPRGAWLSGRKEEPPFRGELDRQSLGGPLESGIDFARRWFARSVRHLGPLRAPPQPLYGLPEAASGASVGQNGEYTAAVLSAYGKRLTPLPMPDGSIQRARLSTAVDRWMAQLGLLAAVQSHERGKFGYELEVSVEGVSRPLDLTTVGVGVSQALPIIVLGLIAEPNSLLLFEQPELHLHPDVQAALGDFFLALARSGRQLIIETHSEYLVNRLRRRQVTDDAPDAAELVRLFFFERDGASAKVTPARIGPDGSMPSWPRGFLDTAAREVEEMVLKERS